MGKVVWGMAMSLDGFIQDADGKVGRLYPDFEGMHDTQQLKDSIERTGAVLMGRRTFDMAHGDYTGYEFQTPIFVVTHEPPQTSTKGENDRLKVHFVTEGLRAAVEQAKAAAGDKDLTLVGGAALGSQCIREGLIDQIAVDVMPVLLGKGLRMFEAFDAPVTLETIGVMEGFVGGTTLYFRVMK